MSGELAEKIRCRRWTRFFFLFFFLYFSLFCTFFIQNEKEDSTVAFLWLCSTSVVVVKMQKALIPGDNAPRRALSPRANEISSTSEPGVVVSSPSGAANSREPQEGKANRHRTKGERREKEKSFGVFGEDAPVAFPGSISSYVFPFPRDNSEVDNLPHAGYSSRTYSRSRLNSNRVDACVSRKRERKPVEKPSNEDSCTVLK
ncbi:hypothetical protein PUN28_001477 [Cardiocondyla obscurior]|uniref:Uncharacterized protein n=1 Tax=Cardiocondyla obscurior TaxID=286306 RepID=A0AAW2H568_9HYME